MSSVPKSDTELHIARSILAEKNIFGVMLAHQSHDYVLELSDRLQPTDFFLPAHQALFRASLEVARRKESLTSEGIKRRMEASDLEKFGGDAWISEFFDYGFARVSIEDQIGAVLKDSRRRRVMQIADRILKATSAEELEPEEIERHAVHELEQLAARFAPVEEPPEPFTGFYEGITSLESEHSEMPEEIIHGGPRGQVVECVAPPDGGKSTNFMNVGLSLAAGVAFPPLVPAAREPMRVVYLDFESTAAELRKDLNVMLTNIEDRDQRILAISNFFPVVDATRNGDPLSLSDHDHMKFVTEWCRKVNADAVVVDTVSSAFEIVSENDNSEVRNRVMRPMRNLAQKLNALVIFLHHNSKATELETDEGSYQGRGASAFGSLSRAVYTLKKEPTMGEGYVTLLRRHRSHRRRARRPTS